MAMEEIHIWLGYFKSKQEYLSCMEETYSEDDNDPINKFSADQGLNFYDTDWEESFFEETGNLKELISKGSYSSDYLDKVLNKVKSEKISNINTFIMLDKNEVKSAKTVMK